MCSRHSLIQQNSRTNQQRACRQGAVVLGAPHKTNPCKQLLTSYLMVQCMCVSTDPRLQLGKHWLALLMVACLADQHAWTTAQRICETKQSKPITNKQNFYTKESVTAGAAPSHRDTLRYCGDACPQAC